MSRELERMRKQSMAKVEATQNIIQKREAVVNHINQVGNEYKRVTDVSRNAPAIVENIDRQFKEKTKLTDGDIKFLFLCTAMQCARQYLLANDKFRLEDKGSLKSNVRGEILMKHAYDAVPDVIAPPEWKKVLFQPVPYDTTNHSSFIHYSDSQKLSGINHRYRTLGHDPILGWIFGPANIMTNSLTETDFVTTYQSSNNVILRHYPMGTTGMLNRAAGYAKDDPMLLAASVARQAIHFGSDYFTKQGLPIPAIATVNNNLAGTMITKCHIDMWSVTRGAVVATLINQLIAVIHRLFYDEAHDGSETMYEVRTRKVLSYSNAIAVGSNVVVTAITKDLQKLDGGGILVALHRFISDTKFIQEVKRDFLKDEIYNMVVGKPYDFMEG